MSSLAYTVRDTPEVVARVEADLAKIVRVVRRDDPHVRSIVLTGGFARGEGAMLDGAPQNDYDLVAVRGWGSPWVPYDQIRKQLELDLGLHIDLAPVHAWRLRWVGRSIFWYETARRGRVLWGEELLHRIRIQEPTQLKATEGLRLLVNRGAGLLLVTPVEDAHQYKIQAAKALLAAFDAHLLARGEFLPSQTERWHRFEALCAAGAAPRALVAQRAWFEWAYRFKVDPATAPAADHLDAWRTGARAILDTVPVALRHAGLRSLKDYERQDGWVDRVQYFRRASAVPGANPWVMHPTGRVRVATLRLLEASLDGVVRPEAAQRVLGPIATVDARPLQTLENLRGATMQ